MNEQRFNYLVEQYIAGRAAKSEMEEFFELLQEPFYTALLESILLEDWQTGRYEEEQNPQIGALIERFVSGKIQRKTPVRSLWPRWVAAASIILILGAGSYFVFFNRSSNRNPVATQQQRFRNDVNPGGYKAKLTLADGKTIVLDSAAVGELAKQGKTIILNKNGQLVYNAQGKDHEEVLYNTLSTGRGETYATVLADGSKVWLNSASSIKYPVAFNGKERRVEITGEAYFEVKHNDAMPFIVNVNGMEVHDMGTEFNINAYPDETEIKTTLVAGSARVVPPSPKGEYKILTPGQQAQVKMNGELSIVNNADVESVVAWKSGRFLFKSADIKTLMRQLNRWYDIEVSYETIPGIGFNAKISRETPLSSILKALELTGEVRFRIEGKKVVVASP